MPKKIVGIPRALDYLRSNLHNNAWRIGESLPSCRKLALLADVSLVSMFKALAVLKKEGLIISKPQSGIFRGQILPPKNIDSVLKDNGPKWQSVRDQLSADILKGSFRGKEFLPTFKEMQTRYKTGFHTIRKAIGAIAKDGLLSMDLRHYRINTFDTQSPHKTICLFLANDTTNFIFYTPEKNFVSETMKGLENECTQRSISLTKCSLPYNADFTLDKDLLKNSLGYIVWYSVQMKEHIITLLTVLAKSNKPIAIISAPNDHSPDDYKKLTDFIASKPNIFISDKTSDCHAGKMMGRFLFGKGHTNICYITANRGTFTTSMYLKGISDAYAAFGLPDAVTPLFTEDISEAERSQASDERTRHLKSVSEKDTQFFSTTINSFGTYLPSPQKIPWIMQINEWKFARDYLYVYSPLFKKARAMTNATAWVMGNVSSAVYGALEYLKGEGTQIPGQPGIAAFGDEFEATMHNISTWRYNYTEAARKMVSLILYPEHSRKALCFKGTNVFSIDGLVIDRGSV